MFRRALFILLAAACMAPSARAENELLFDAPTNSVSLAGQVTLDLTMAFDDTTTGGGLEITYDPSRVSLSSVVFDSGFSGDPDFSCPGSSIISCPPNSNFISFGSLLGVDGSQTIASLVFDAVGLGTSEISASIVNQFDNGAGSPLAVQVTPASIQVVPEPGTATLLGLSLMGLAARRKRG